MVQVKEGLCARVLRSRSFWVVILLASCYALLTGAQNPQSTAPHAAKIMALHQARYELRQGEPTQVLAPEDTVNFLLKAKSRSVEVDGAKAKGLVVAPNGAGDQMMVAASQRATPGEHQLVISATSDSGEVREASLTVDVKPRVTVPTGSTRPPVVLLNGWQIGFTNTCNVAQSSSETFGNLAQYLVSDGVPVVYLFDNCLEDPNQPFEVLGNDLGDFLNTIQYDNGQQVPQIDLVAFSSGGLIARSYLAGLQPNQSLNPPVNTLVRKLVLIASPNFGSFVAGNYANVIQVGTQSGELIPASSFLWNLANWNQRTDDLHGVDAIAVIGNAGSYTPLLGSTTLLNNASDGIVSLTSASLGFVAQKSSVTRIVPYCHIDPSAYTNTTLGNFLCNAPGIANVTSQSQSTGQIVRSFLSGTSDWKSIGSEPASDPYLTKNGGMFFSMVNSGGSYVSDLSQVTWGTVQLTMGGAVGSIFYQDFVAGTGVFTAASQSLGSTNCGSYSQATGYSSAVRCKINTVIFSVGPLLSTAAGRVVTAGSTITINGSRFGGQCVGCKVVATPAGSNTGQALQVNSWSDQTITAMLPSSLTGFLTLTVSALPGTDSMAILAAAPLSAPAISAVPGSLQFAYTTAGATPDAQSVQITNSGTGALAWNASVTSSWLSLSSASGTAPSTLSVSISPAGLSAGTYNDTIQIASTGASNTPQSIPVTLTVTQPVAVLSVAPQSLTFSYSVGDAASPSQSLSITNTGGGSLAWTASTNDYWIALSANSGSAPGSLAISINPANLAAGTYTSAVQVTASGASGSPISIPITLTVQGTQPAGNITGVANAGSFQAGLASATWISIFGTNLSSATATWQTSDYVNGLLPTSLEGVSVTINGTPAYIAYISPNQINALAPDDVTTGAVQVQVTAANQASNTFTATKSQFSPAFFTLGNGAYVAALHADYSVIGKSNLIPGTTTQPAKPGETILLFGTGFGPTNPPTPTAQLVSAPAVLANSAQVTIGGMQASVIFAGLVQPGLYQFNVTVPAVPNGDAAVVATIGGVTTQTGVSLTVQQ